MPKTVVSDGYNPNKKRRCGRALWLSSIIPAILEAEIRGESWLELIQAKS
jgi:hypothetical protein